MRHVLALVPSLFSSQKPRGKYFPFVLIAMLERAHLWGCPFFNIRNNNIFYSLNITIFCNLGMSIIDPLDLYWAFAPFFFRLLQTIQGFYFFIFYIFHLHPFLGHYIQLWVGTHSWALSPHLWGFVFVHGLLHLIQGFLVLDLQPF